MADLEIRPARADDRAAVLAFCEGTWDDGDYIAEVWDEWLGDASGALLVGVLEGKPVGVAHLHLVSPEEGWLEGVRVDPALRRHGIGQALALRALVTARERGAGVVRLFTSGDNVPSQRLFESLGFEQVASFVSYAAPAQAHTQEAAVPAGAALRRASVADLEPLWAFLEGSNLVPLNGGLILDGWRAKALTSAVLEDRLAAGDVHVLEAWGVIQGLAIVEARRESRRGPQLVAQYVDGAAEGISRLALALRGAAAEAGLTRVTLTIPDLLILHDAMDGAGFARRGEYTLLCYARQLPPRQPGG
jgi:ribosomal protein S18 acetylase RimI-like enzyme